MKWSVEHTFNTMQHTREKYTKKAEPTTNLQKQFQNPIICSSMRAPQTFQKCSYYFIDCIEVISVINKTKLTATRVCE